LVAATVLLGSASSSITGLFAGGFTTVYTNVIQYVTIATTGNTTDFGDLATPLAYISSAGCSNAHGGI
jgi:hypothetical protein